MMRVLHITAWHPTPQAPAETPFVQRHVQALDGFTENEVWHIDARAADHWGLSRRNPLVRRAFLARCGTRRWRIIEWVAGVLILWAWLTRDRSRRVDLVNFHIAYPNCAWLGLFRWVMRRPLVITEHFSAYHFKFNGTGAGMRRIKRIFHRGVPVITVSRALADDIRAFAGPPHPPFHVIDNVVDTSLFRPGAARRTEGRFFALAQWRYPKRPEALIEAVALLRDQGVRAQLRLGGDGPLCGVVRERIDALGLGDRVVLLGRLSQAEAAEEMRQAHAFVHAADYETYSAVCAEALCCGTFTIASRVGGIPEYLHEGLGALVDENSGAAWAAAIRGNWERALHADALEIARAMGARCAPQEVGARYAGILNGIKESWRA